jgi:single-strand DNA-binding protein
MNHTTLIGNLGKDPTLRHTESGKAVTEFSLAVDSYAQRQDSDADPGWFQIVVWGGLAEVVAEHKRKGDEVAIHGRLTPVRYERDGIEVRSYKITATDVEFLGRKRRNSDSAVPADGQS